MNVRIEINREDLLNCDEDDENERLKEFYERNLPFLKKYPEKTVLADIARILHKTLLGQVYWREYAASLGITDSDELDKIEVSAEKNKEQELFTVFTRVLPKNKGFDHVIRMLIVKNRFDALKKIYHVAEGLIAESHRTNVKGFAMIEPLYSSDDKLTSRGYSIQELVSDVASSNNSSYDNTSMRNHTSQFKRDFDSLQQSSKSDSYKTETIIPDPIADLDQNSLSEKYIVPSAPMHEIITVSKISVFIQHTKCDAEYARQLCEKLRKAEFKVKTMSDMILAMNDVEALHAIFDEVDFIVPVVSESLLKVIHTPQSSQSVDSTDAVNNKMFYQWIMNEYQRNNCINFRVRPVIVPGMSRQKITKDIVLKFSFRFGIEDDKLIRILRETKDLIPEYNLLVNSV